METLRPVKKSTYVPSGSNEVAAVTSTAIAIAGSVDSGKSSFIGVCVKNMLDNGKGLARSWVAKHQHEIDSGQTSDISIQILKLGNGHHLTFVDLCGHEKYLKTTVRGISSYFPDYCCLIVSPQRGVTDITKQHFKMLHSQNIPMFIIVTRADVATHQAYIDTRKAIKNMCKNMGGGQQADFINLYKDYHSLKEGKTTEEEFDKKKTDDTLKLMDHLKLNSFGKQAVVPVVTVSNVTGYYMDVCRNAMKQMLPRDIWDQTSKNNRVVKMFQNRLGIKDDDINRSFSGTVFYRDATFKPQGVPGFVLSGIVRGDPVNIGDSLWLGPFGKEFFKVDVKSIHNNNRQPIPTLPDHGRGCCNIKIVGKIPFEIKRESIRKGVIMVSKDNIKRLCYRFKAAIHVYNTSSLSIAPGYSPVIHIGPVSQSARVIKDESFKEVEDDKGKFKLRKIVGTGSIVELWFKFKREPEVIIPGSLLTFRSGSIHGVGMVTEILPIEVDEDARPDMSRKELSMKKSKNVSKTNVIKKTFQKIQLKL